MKINSKSNTAYRDLVVTSNENHWIISATLTTKHRKYAIQFYRSFCNQSSGHIWFALPWKFKQSLNLLQRVKTGMICLFKYWTLTKQTHFCRLNTKSVRYSDNDCTRNKFAYVVNWVKIQQAILSQFFLPACFFIGKLPVKD